MNPDFDTWAMGLLLLATLATMALPLRTRRPQWIATLIAGLALAWLTLPAPAATPNVPVLLATEGTTMRLLDQARLSLATSGPAYILGPNEDWPAPIERITDAGVLARRYPGREVQVAGHGLEPWDIDRLQAQITPVATPSLPPGISHISWQRSLGVGEVLVVAGRLTDSFEQVATLQLTGTGGSAEVLLDPAVGQGVFEIQLTPPGAGRFLFDLTLTSSNGQESRVGTIDTDVQAVQPPTLLWLERAPSFETRHVKEWLADLGGSIAVRSAVSRQRFRYEYHNLSRSNLTRLTIERLREFDIVVADHGSWSALAPAERGRLEELVEEGALGLILRLNPTSATLPFEATARRVEGLEHLMFRPAFADAGIDPIALPPFELVSPGESLISDPSGRTLAVRQRYGLGSVGLTTVADSYRWALAGRQSVHRDYWRTLIESVAPPSGGTHWRLAPGPVILDEPFAIELIAETPPEVTLHEPDGARSRLPMRQHPTQPQRFSAVLQPRLTGWHRLSAAGAETAFHTGTSNSWEVARLARRQRATRTAASSHYADSAITSAKPRGRLMAFFIALAALAFAWVDERRGRRSA
jgi:hypothetical protein